MTSLRQTLAALIMLAPLAAIALPNHMSAQPPVPPAPPGTAPVGIGRPHTCPMNSYYPQQEIRLGHQGTTMVGFKVAVDGTTKDITVLKSSGYDTLDQAAIACAATWVYRPAMQNGQPVEVPWRANVRWAIMDPVPQPSSGLPPGTTTPVPIGAQTCSALKKSGDTSPGAAQLSFTVSTEGSVRNIIVKQSSGDAGFDASAVACVSLWRYRPATSGGLPVPITWKTTVNW